MKNKYNGGFTLVELLVTIVVASIVTLAAGTVLLLGMRLNKSSTSTSQRQNTVRIFMSVVEKMATEGAIGSVESKSDSWYALDSKGEKILFYYDDRVIYTGGERLDDGCTGGTPIMEDVFESSVTLESQLLTVQVKTKDGTYKTSAYCRAGATLVRNENADISDAEENLYRIEGLSESQTEARLEFLEVLISQEGSTGTIFKNFGGTIINTKEYYVQWYSQNFYNMTWDRDTAWCGCFLSWGLDGVKEYLNASSHDWYLRFADVKNGEAFFKDKDNYRWENAEYLPIPGDVIFFDWDGTRVNAGHVGVVLAVKDDCVYTIEGNSANMVRICQYPVNDTRIMGYGVLDWKT